MERGEIVYIVLMAIFLLSRLLKKKKKPVPQEQAQVEPVFSGEGVQDFDDWLMGKEITAPKPVSKVPEKKIAKTAEKKAVQQTKPQNFSELNLTAANNINLNIELNTVEDARKAFIYSEIFQRKY